MKQWSYLPGAPVVNSVVGLTNLQVIGRQPCLAYLHILVMICIPLAGNWRGHSFIIPSSHLLLVLSASEGSRPQLRHLESGYSCWCWETVTGALESPQQEVLADGNVRASSHASLGGVVVLFSRLWTDGHLQSPVVWGCQLAWVSLWNGICLLPDAKTLSAQVLLG